MCHEATVAFARYYSITWYPLPQEAVVQLSVHPK
jgi:hypothetical protein